MAYENLLYEVADGIATITVNRPHVFNALNRATMVELEKAFTAARDDGAVRVLILTGAGEKAFIGGADVKELHEIIQGGAAAGRDTLPLSGQRLIKLMLGLGKPIIAAVNGYCLGGGCELIYACTLTYAATGAKFGHPEVNQSLSPFWGGTQQLTRLVGTKKTMELLLLGEMFDAAEALRLEIINGVVPAEELILTVRKIAAALAAKSPLAVRCITECVHQADDLMLDAVRAPQRHNGNFKLGYAPFQQHSRTLSAAIDSWLPLRYGHRGITMLEDPMINRYLNDAFSELSTPLIADACLRLGLPLRLAPPGIRPLVLRGGVAGQVLPARHYGSVDIFLEAMGLQSQETFSS